MSRDSTESVARVPCRPRPPGPSTCGLVWVSRLAATSAEGCQGYRPAGPGALEPESPSHQGAFNTSATPPACVSCISRSDHVFIIGHDHAVTSETLQSCLPAIPPPSATDLEGASTIGIVGASVLVRPRLQWGRQTTKPDKCTNHIKARKFFWNVLPDLPSHSGGTEDLGTLSLKSLGFKHRSQSSRFSSPTRPPTTLISVAQSVAPHVLSLQTLILLLLAFSLLQGSGPGFNGPGFNGVGQAPETMESGVTHPLGPAQHTPAVLGCKSLTSPPSKPISHRQSSGPSSLSTYAFWEETGDSHRESHLNEPHRAAPGPAGLWRPCPPFP